MPEYIERDVALSMHEPSKLNRHYQTDNLDDAYGQGWDDALCCLEQLPAADVAPVVHGRWEYIPQTLNTLSKLRCSFCGWWSLDPSIDGAYNYCPNCGAKMDGGAENA